MSTDIELAYLGGLFDGEGSFSIQVQIKDNKGIKAPNFGPKMSMTLKYGWQSPLTRLYNKFGGTIYHYEDGMHRWNLGTRRELIFAAETLQPYLDIKRPICKKFLEALYLFPTTRNNHVAGERTWTPELTAEVCKIALTLNPERSRKSNKTLDYLNELASIYDTIETNQKVDAVLV